MDLAAGDHVILGTPTGSGKSLVALGMLFMGMAQGKRCYYTAPIKALVSEKFFDLVQVLGRSVILSRRFSFVRPFSRLYCPVVMPDHAREISSVRIAYSLPFCTPSFFHSSVSSFRMRIAKSR